MCTPTLAACSLRVTVMTESCRKRIHSNRLTVILLLLLHCCYRQQATLPVPTKAEAAAAARKKAAAKAKQTAASKSKNKAKTSSKAAAAAAAALATDGEASSQDGEHDDTVAAVAAVAVAAAKEQRQWKAAVILSTGLPRDSPVCEVSATSAPAYTHIYSIYTVLDKHCKLSPHSGAAGSDLYLCTNRLCLCMMYTLRTCRLLKSWS
jgi:pyruvate/2-oxoglutarate dehydrogenase complex dihydrolipoamide acyltransferase (E2) component